MKCPLQGQSERKLVENTTVCVSIGYNAVLGVFFLGLKMF